MGSGGSGEGGSRNRGGGGGCQGDPEEKGECDKTGGKYGELFLQANVVLLRWFISTPQINGGGWKGANAFRK